MTPQDFVYWLNGYVELGGGNTVPTESQWKMICDHLKLVMTKVTPPLDCKVSDINKDWLDGVIKALNQRIDQKADKAINNWQPFPGVTPKPFEFFPIENVKTIC